MATYAVRVLNWQPPSGRGKKATPGLWVDAVEGLGYPGTTEYLNHWAQTGWSLHTMVVEGRGEGIRRESAPGGSVATGSSSWVTSLRFVFEQ